MNHRYDDGAKNIGRHVRDLHELGLIVVLRTGRRAFQVRDKEAQRMVFDRVLEPFVPKEVEATTASSFTFRTSARREPQEALCKKIQRRTEMPSAGTAKSR